MRIWAILPARWGSSRLPGKVLADIHGRTMLEHVWRRTCEAPGIDRVAIASDDDAVLRCARAFGAEGIVAGPADSGTARVALAVGAAPVAVINVQADQPLLDPAHLQRLADLLRQGAAIATLAAPYAGDPADPARVKIRWDGVRRAIDFSRRPFEAPADLHVGLYGFAPGVIQRCAAAPRSARSVAEDLEQLAWLDAGLPIDVGAVDSAGPSVDTAADLERVRAIWSAPTP